MTQPTNPTSTTTTSTTKKKPRGNSPTKKKTKSKTTKNETWRLYGITTHPDEDDWYTLQAAARSRGRTTPDDQQPQSQTTEAPVPVALQQAVWKKLKVDSAAAAAAASIAVLPKITVVRRSLDARRKLEHPTFQYVVDVTLTPTQVKEARLAHKPGRLERIVETVSSSSRLPATVQDPSSSSSSLSIPSKRVVVVGAGPAGLFCALQLVLWHPNIQVVLVERGQPVEQRGKDIGALMHRTRLNANSNFAFGEGGAGTWSDGKLTTRIGRNSQNVRWILEQLVQYGAPAQILWEGAPHLGTDNLVRLLRNLRHDLQDRFGTEIMFGTRMTNLKITEQGFVQGVHVERTNPDGSSTEVEFLPADAVVLATGHSARDVYKTLAATKECCLEAKGFAVGFRIEHPQKLITQIQYGKEWGPTVYTGKRQTDLANQAFFASIKDDDDDNEEHPGRLPVPSYRLATDKANDGTSSERLRGVYSFCMCPGGQIVPASTDPSEVCVNGMSFSKRDSQWANSALVVTIFPDDPILDPYREKYGILAGLEFQRDMERRAADMGRGVIEDDDDDDDFKHYNLTVPVQRVTDFIEGVVSETLPSSSYRLGVKSSPCHEIYPAPITEALRDALTNHFDGQMPGYVHPDGLLHAVETRTSSPLRIARDEETCQAKGCPNLFPAGEGAGFAGGIVSAAVDGRSVAEAVLDHLYGSEREGRQKSAEGSPQKSSVGFSY